MTVGDTRRIPEEIFATVQQTYQRNRSNLSWTLQVNRHGEVTHDADYPHTDKGRIDAITAGAAIVREYRARHEGSGGYGYCGFVPAWSARCSVPGVCRDGLCEEHTGTRCIVCGKTADRTCGETMGPFVCGRALCYEHMNHHRRTLDNPWGDHPEGTP